MEECRQNKRIATPTTAPTSTPLLTVEEMTDALNGTTSPSPIADSDQTLRPTPSPSSFSNDSSTMTLAPSITAMPSGSPIFNSLSIDRNNFRQDFLLPTLSSDFFNATEEDSLASIFGRYTISFAPSPEEIHENLTECVIETQIIYQNNDNRSINSLDYFCLYSSNTVNVTGFSSIFLTFLNTNLENLTEEMIASSIRVETALTAVVRQIQTPAPTSSAKPSQTPTLHPSVSFLPSFMPSLVPSSLPTEPMLPTTPPFLLRPTMLPTLPPIRSRNMSVGAIATVVIFGGLVVLAGLFIYYRSWSKKRDEHLLMRYDASSSAAAESIASSSALPGRSLLRGSRQSAASLNRIASSGASATGNSKSGISGMVNTNIMDGSTGSDEVVPPTDSLQSNKSLLSEGVSGLDEDSGDEIDGTRNLQDEFDQYKDKNLEQLRADVEGNLSGFEGIMSAAVTNALMGGDEEANTDMQDLLWGCSRNPDGTEIEASALFEVSDWLKRNESAGGERKRAFMQEILNKMVTSVRHGVIVAEDASRTIHEAAAILGLQLADELPVTTVIVSGMRKTTTAYEMEKVMHEFGDIDIAAVASGKRGFGILRFRRRKSVDLALQRYKSGEIVILDVNIQMKVIMPSGVIESR